MPESIGHDILSPKKSFDHEKFHQIKHDRLYGVSKERISEELIKEFEQSPKPDKVFEGLVRTHLLYTIFPDYEDGNKIHHGVAGSHYGESMIQHEEDCLRRTPVNTSPYFKLAVALHDIGKTKTYSTETKKGFAFLKHETVGADIVKKDLKRLKFSNQQIDYITELVKQHMKMNSLLSDKKFAKLFIEENENIQFMNDLLLLSEIDQNNLGGEWQKEHKKLIDKWSVSPKLITGDDVIKYPNTDTPNFTIKDRQQLLLQMRWIQLTQNLDRTELLKLLDGQAKEIHKKKEKFEVHRVVVPSNTAYPKVVNENIQKLHNGARFELPVPEHKFIKLIDAIGKESQVFIVGGSIRDYLYTGKLDFNDIDLAVSEDIQPLMKHLKAEGFHVVPTGERFGIFQVNLDGTDVDVGRFRAETYKSGDRHPEIRPVRTIDEDLARRDFTINSFALKYLGDKGNTMIVELIDKFAGMNDLRNGIIRAIGNPKERFNEDSLRKMRANRFYSKFGFEYDPETLEAIKNV